MPPAAPAANLSLKWAIWISTSSSVLFTTRSLWVLVTLEQRGEGVSGPTAMVTTSPPGSAQIPAAGKPLTGGSKLGVLVGDGPGLAVEPTSSVGGGELPVLPEHPAMKSTSAGIKYAQPGRRHFARPTRTC